MSVRLEFVSVNSRLRLNLFPRFRLLKELEELAQVGRQFPAFPVDVLL